VQNNLGERSLVKLIKPRHMSQVRFEETVVNGIIRHPLPHIAVVYREWWNDDEGIVVRMEEHQFALRRWITDNRVWYEFDWFPIMSGLAIRLALAHSIGALHKDLKPSNSSFPLPVTIVADELVLIDRQTDGRFYENGIHISDFGLPYCTRLPVNGQPREVPGTYAYMSPEILRNGEESISASSDIWAAGCIGYELCLGRKLAGNRPLLKQHISRGGQNPATLETLIASVPARFGEVVRNVLRGCLAWEPANRCSAAALQEYLLRQGRR
jgi:serine/threonine protein kinase